MATTIIRDRIARGVLAISASTVVGVYAGLPVALGIAARLRPRNVQTEPMTSGRVTAVVAAYDEAAAIERKLDELAAQRLGPNVEYKIVVASDGSTDRTVELARAHPAKARVLDLGRGGKAVALNRSLAEVDDGIVVFTDANSRLGPDALATLIEPFADPAVGGVAGSQRYGRGGVDAKVAEADYWSYEDRLKRYESAIGSVVSATGTLYAVRRELIDRVPDGVTDDFWISTGVVDHGSRLVFEPRAMAWEDPADGAPAEYRRKVRIVTRGLNGVWLRRRLFNVRRHGFYAVVLFVHKVLRRALFVPLAAAVAAASVLGIRNRFWRLGALSAWASVAASIAANLSAAPWTRHRAVRALAHLGLSNLAAAHGFLRLVGGHKVTMWEPER